MEEKQSEIISDNFDVFGKFLIVKIEYIPNELKSESGVILAINTKPAQTTYYTAIVISIGDEITPGVFNVGDRVLVKGFSGQKVYHLGNDRSEDDYVKFHEKDIEGIVGKNIDITPIKNFKSLSKVTIN